MAGLRGDQASWGLAKQSVKGAPVTPPTDQIPFSGGDEGPTRTTDQLSETDANRDEGVTFVQQTGSAGQPELYVRTSNIHHVLDAVLGATVHSGSTNFTHVSTPANALSYFTFTKSLGGTLYEQYSDALVNEVTISADAGNPLSATVDFQGRAATRLTVDPFLGGPALASDQVLNYNNAAVTLGGVATALVGSFELTITNNITVQQTDDSVPYDVVPGKRQVTLGFDLIFENLTEYNKFHYGGASGTTQSPTLYTTSADFVFSLGINNSVEFSLPSISYEEFPVQPDPDGAPVVASVRARAQRGASPVVTATVLNQVAT